ncbi:MAG: phosphoribosylanthranilate isomerase [Deltaproteobacteria bacterium]|nr:phosphoribosylanthranilate isomerase [Deltaproteobacteria bacterium]
MTETVHVKICGITRPEDALAAEEAGADMIGFVFADSPRRVTPATAASIVTQLKRAKAVGVFDQDDVANIRGIVGDVGLSFIQLHKIETAVTPSDFGVPVFKAVKGNHPLSADDEEIVRWDYVLVDASANGRFGGTGRAFDWANAMALSNRGKPRLIVAGGLTPDTVADAVRALNPWAVDVSSGVEAAPGVKDRARVAAFIRNAKEARR